MWKIAPHILTEIVFPKRCVICQKYGSFICTDCKEILEISPVHRPDHNFKYLEDIFSTGSYENKYLKKIIHNFKFEPFCRQLGTEIAGLIEIHLYLTQAKIKTDNSIIIPVPLAKKRLRWRGFNQSQIIAEKLGAKLNIPVAADILVRIRETKPQTELDRPKRQNNIKNAFACNNQENIRNKSILLVDDVVTTGATMEECARILIKNKANNVIGISIARAEKPIGID